MKLIKKPINFDALVQFAIARREDFIAAKYVEGSMEDFVIPDNKAKYNKFTLHELGAELDVLLAQTHLCYNKPNNAADILANAITSNLF